jgi:hypothetical protein
VKAVVWHGIGDIRMETVPDPKILEPSDAIVRITRSAICGTDLHMVRGTMPGMVEGTVLGHEAVGVVGHIRRPDCGFMVRYGCCHIDHGSLHSGLSVQSGLQIAGGRTPGG